MTKTLKHGCYLIFLAGTVEVLAQNENITLLQNNSFFNSIYLSVFLAALVLILIFLLIKNREKLNQINKENEDLKKYQESSDRLKSDFLTQISHEIRTPVNSILCFSSLIQQELENNLPDELKEGFGIIESGGRRLIRTIDLILNMSEIQAGNFELNISKFDLEKELIFPLIKEFRNFAESKGLSLTYHVSNESESYVECDKHMTTQILIHLLDNALKYTEKGSVEIVLYKNKDKKYCIDVIDTGIGIGKEFQKLLFTPFMQEESGYTRKYEGNGLGLALIKKYCDINKINISIKSKKWEGTTVTIVFSTFQS